MATGADAAAALAAVLDSPAMPAPEGVTPNFDNPPNMNGLAVAIITLTLVIASVCLLLRAYARVYLLRKVQVEEFLIISAFAVYCAQTYCCYALIDTPGYFVHQWNLKFGALISTGYNVLLIGSFYQTILPLLKSAILIEWIRLFCPPGNRIKSPFFLGCVFVIVLQVSWGIACVVLLNVQCTPHESIWKFYIPERQCFDLVPVQLASGGVQLASDIIMLILPQKIIWGLRLTWKKKLGVSFIFSLGILACISAAFRLSVTVTYGYSQDQMFTLGPVVFWVMAETTCGFIIVCMPCLPKIFKDTGVLRKIKQTFGMKVTTNEFSGATDQKYGKYGYRSKYGTGVSSLSRSAATVDAYQKLDEEGGVALRNMQTESTEQLRRPDDSKNKILRTTQVTVHASDGASHNSSDGDMPGPLRSGPPRAVDTTKDSWYR